MNLEVPSWRNSSKSKSDEQTRASSDQIPVTDGGKDVELEMSIDEQRRLLSLITQETRATLIQNILGHRWMMPSKKELDYYNPEKSSGTITGHLNKLTDEGIVTRLVVPQGERIRKGPSAFFTLTDKGYQLLDSHSIFLPQVDEIREDHSRVEKTEEIERYENAPRPTVDVEYDHPLKGDGRQVVDPEEYAEDRDEDDPKVSNPTDRRQIVGDAH